MTFEHWRGEVMESNGESSRGGGGVIEREGSIWGCCSEMPPYTKEKEKLKLKPSSEDGNYPISI